MRDFPPRDKERRERVLGVIRATYQRHGFEEIETPALEDRAVLHSGMGGDNEKLSFSVVKRGLSLEDFRGTKSLDDVSDLGLRFDLTVPLARFYASHHGQLPAVFRSFHTGPVWRAERPQKGRYRQFLQCDIDIVGESSVLAEVEVILATADALDHLGLGGFSFRVNDRRLLGTLLSAAGIAPEHHPTALIILDKLDKIGLSAVLEELTATVPAGFDSSVVGGLVHGAQGDFDPVAIAALMGGTPEALTAATELCDWASAVVSVRGPGQIIFDPTLVRGMGYYTGSIVEISHPDWGISIGGGGRYDAMVGKFLGRDVPAFGLSLGFERLVEILPGDLATDPDRVALLYDAWAPESALLALKMQLVASGHTVRLVANSKNMRPVFEQLREAGFSRVAQADPEFTDAGSLVWKELSGGH